MRWRVDMPENNKAERELGGAVSETSSSDAAIEARLEDLTSEVHAVDTNIVDTQILPSIPLASDSTGNNSVSEGVSGVRNLDPGAMDSAFGLTILKDRQIKKS